MADASFKHPEITPSRLVEWQRMRACSLGEAFVKSQNENFLPMPSGFAAMSDRGVAAYNAYQCRAQFPEMFEPTVSAMVGMIHDKGITIELPSGLEGITARTNVGSVKLDIEEFHRIITRGLLTLGRYGVLADAPASGGEVYLVGHEGDRIINWDKDFYVLDETKYVRDGFNWAEVPSYRVLEISDGTYVQSLWVNGAKSGDMSQAQDFPRTISGVGGSSIDELPFYVGNARQMTPQIETPPLAGVATPSIANYQLSADYRWQLFMSGQETLVAINGESPSAVGAGVSHEMHGAEGVTPDLKYVSPTCRGIESHKDAMSENRLQASIAGARLLMEGSQTGQESGKARSLRYGSETASILTVARTSCMILQSALRAAATMQNLDPEQVIVTPPTDLLDKTLSAADLKILFDIYNDGGMSFEAYFNAAQRGGWQPEGMSADEEWQRIEDPLFSPDGEPGESEQSGNQNQSSSQE